MVGDGTDADEAKRGDRGRRSCGALPDDAAADPLVRQYEGIRDKKEEGTSYPPLLQDDDLASETAFPGVAPLAALVCREGIQKLLDETVGRVLDDDPSVDPLGVGPDDDGETYLTTRCLNTAADDAVVAVAAAADS